MKVLGRIVLALISIIVLVVVAAAIMLATFNPNDHKAQITTAVKNATGRDLAINGNIGIVFYPVLGLEAEQVVLGNPEGFTEKEFLSVGKVQAGVRILPLLHKQVELTKVYMDSPSITIIKTAGGNNLDFKKPGSAAAGKETAASAQPAEGNAKNVSFSVEGVEIKDARVVSIDKVAGKTTTIDPLNLSLPGFTPGKKTSFKLDMTVKPEGVPPTSLSLSGDADVNIKAETADISDLKLNANGTDLTGKVSVKGFKKSEVTFSFNAASLDLDAMMGQKGAAAKTEAGSAPSPAKAANDNNRELFPVQALRDMIALNGDLSVGTLKFSGLTMTDLKTQVSAANGLLKADPFTMNLYDGSMVSSLQLDVRGATPAVSAKGELKNVQMGGILKDKVGEDYLTGLANSSFDLTLHGNTVRTLQSNSGGTAKFALGEGYINKWQLSKLINQAINYLQTGNMTAPADDKIKFTSMDFMFNGSNGVFRNDDLQLIAPLSHALGNGMIDFATQTVDYTVGIGLGDNPEKFAKKTRIPIRISGPLSAPHYQIDFKSLALEKFQEKKDELINKAVDKLFGGKDKQPAPATTDGSTAQPAPSAKEELGKELLNGLLGGGKK